MKNSKVLSFYLKLCLAIIFTWLNLIINLCMWKQRVVLNGQHSSWTNVQAGIPHGSILGPLFFLIYINDLSDDLTSKPKLFADDTSLFSVVQNINSTANDRNTDLMKISDWIFQWKMKFNSHPKNKFKRWFSVENLTKLSSPVVF